MKKKQQIGMFVGIYEKIVADARGNITTDEIFAKLKPQLAKFHQQNTDVALRNLFTQIEKRALSSTDSVVQEDHQGTMTEVLNHDCVVALGDQQRSLYRYCNRDMLEKRRAVLKENRDAVVAQADKEIAAIDNALAVMKADDTYEDI